VGDSALAANTTGISNTALGRNALSSAATVNSNTAVGTSALRLNSSNQNTAVGALALDGNTTACCNTAVGAFAMSGSGGGSNAAVGQAALQLTSGNSNTAVGTSAMANSPSGDGNVAVGLAALGNASGNLNIAIGRSAGLNVAGGSSNIHVGHLGLAADSATIRIGTPGTQTATFVAGIRGVTTGTANAIPVLVDSAGQLGTVSSTGRAKQDVADMGAASRDLLGLRPVTFRYRQASSDGTRPRQYGLVAEEVAEVYPDLVAYDDDGQPSTVFYHVLPAMLLNELQRQERELTALRGELAELRDRLEALGALQRAARSGE
jgi:hypothetical protein